MPIRQVNASKQSDIDGNLGFKAVASSAIMKAALDDHAATINAIGTDMGDMATATTTAKTTVGAVNEINANRAKQTTANLTYYVATTGSDSNNGTSSGTPFLTIGKAISLIPQIVNHAVTINIAAGTYAEAPTLSGFFGTGAININGGNSLVTAANFIMQGPSTIQCGIFIAINGFTLSTGGVTVARCIRLDLQWIIATAAGGNGITSTSSMVYVSSSTFSNKNYGILADLMSTVHSSGNGGTGNTNGIAAGGASTIGKIGGQPAGTTAEVASGGGVIRS